MKIKLWTKESIEEHEGDAGKVLAYVERMVEEGGRIELSNAHNSLPSIAVAVLQSNSDDKPYAIIELCETIPSDIVRQSSLRVEISSLIETVGEVIHGFETNDLGTIRRYRTEYAFRPSIENVGSEYNALLNQSDPWSSEESELYRSMDANNDSRMAHFFEELEAIELKRKIFSTILGFLEISPDFKESQFQASNLRAMYALGMAVANKFGQVVAILENGDGSDGSKQSSNALQFVVESVEGEVNLPCVTRQSIAEALEMAALVWRRPFKKLIESQYSAAPQQDIAPPLRKEELPPEVIEEPSEDSPQTPPTRIGWLTGIANYFHTRAIEQRAEAERREQAKKAEVERREHDQWKKFDELFSSVVVQHSRSLVTRRLQLLTTDPYGNTDFSRWHDEVLYFIDNVVVKTCPAVSLVSRAELFHYVADKVLRLTFVQSHDDGDSDIDLMDGKSFEAYCAQRLLSYGWNASLTKGSGDQGIDILAERGGTHIAIQCKRYSSSVGNAAVQEAFAGKAFVNAHYAAVVTNASFTPSAKALAGTTGVILLHYSELSSLNSLVQAPN